MPCKIQAEEGFFRPLPTFPSKGFSLFHIGSRSLQLARFNLLHNVRIVLSTLEKFTAFA
jgi:hypothetical protein